MATAKKSSKVAPILSAIVEQAERSKTAKVTTQAKAATPTEPVAPVVKSKGLGIGALIKELLVRERTPTRSL